MSEENKNMFVMRRDFKVQGKGHEIGFIKDVPIHVPPALHAEVMRCGAEALDKETVVHVEEQKKRVDEIQGVGREEKIISAMDKLVTENLRFSFGADGLPTCKAIFRITGIDLEMNERDAVWVKRQTVLRDAEQPTNTTYVAEVKPEVKATIKVEPAAEKVSEKDEKPEPVDAEPAKETPEKDEKPKPAGKKATTKKSASKTAIVSK